MEDTIVSFEVAKALKEKGFNENCSHYYIHEFGNSGYLKKLHGTLKECEAQNDSGDIIGYYKRKNSLGQPHIIIASTLTLAQKWLREVHNIHVNISKVYECSKSPAKFEGWNIYIAGKDFETKYEINNELISKYFDTYESALEDAIQESLKLIK